MGIKFPTHWKTLIIKFPPSRDDKGVKCPGYARGGGGGEGMLKLRFDRYIISLLSISLSLDYKYSPLATSTSVNNCYLKGYTLSPSTDPTSFSLPALQMLFTEYLAYPSFWLIAPSLA